MRTCLVGVDGLLGRQWLETIRSLNHEVIGVGPNPQETLESITSTDRYYQINLLGNSHASLNEIFSQERPNNLVINAGLDARPGTGQDLLDRYTIESWKEIFEVNVFGLVKVLNAAVQAEFCPRNVIVIGSMYSEKSPNPSLYSHYGKTGLTKHPAYASSKFAALGVIKQYASHYANKGVIINMLSPGAVFSGQDTEFLEKISKRIPLNRAANPSEFQSILKYLLEENSYAIGQNFIVDGGMNLW